MALLLLLFALSSVNADIYLHHPRGSNNRCDERTNDRLNANRLFDSQNNAAGGYAVACSDQTLSCFAPEYYENSHLYVRWTTQHACGPENSCRIIIDYMCDDDLRDGVPASPHGSSCTATVPLSDTKDPAFGRHESFEHYQACISRPRPPLFVGSQRLRGNTAQYTRQNPNGNRYGFECPEERDYFPYWAPSPWITAAVLTTDPADCSNTSHPCMVAEATQINRLGSAKFSHREPEYKWTLPETKVPLTCALRIRYNISLPYDPLPLVDNPTVTVLNHTLRLALDTSQLPRTFEDRSHRFRILPRPSYLKGTIHNLGVQGKRGNIAQVRNCFEYDFVPANLTIAKGDFVHFQWVGSDFNPVNNDGEGRRGTDRSNIVAIDRPDTYLPGKQDMFNDTATATRFAMANQDPRYCGALFDDQDPANCQVLNMAPLWFNEYPVKFSEGNRTHHYMCTRNNNFSNRDQKGTIYVRATESAADPSEADPSTVTSDGSNLSLYIMIGVVLMVVGFVVIDNRRRAQDYLSDRFFRIRLNLARRV
jgi:hypothetical protein